MPKRRISSHEHSWLPPRPFPSDTSIANDQETEGGKRSERRERIKRGAKKLGAAALYGIVIPVSIGGAYGYHYLQQDIAYGKEQVADAPPAIHTIYETRDRNVRDVGWYVATGLGTRDASETASKLTSHQEFGNVYAIEYSPEEFDPEILTETIVKQAREHGIKELVFDGYSAGGTMLLAVAANIYEKYDDLHVLGVTMNSSPVGDGALTEKSERMGKLLKRVVQLGDDIGLHGLEYAPHPRLWIEMVDRRGRYMDPGSLSFDYDRYKHEIDDANRTRINNPARANGHLAEEQYDFVVTNRPENSIKRLADHRDGKTQPWLVYTRSDFVGNDPVVNVDVSEANFNRWMEKYGMPADTLRIANISHANPGDRPDEYNRMFAEKIVPLLRYQQLHRKLPQRPNVIAILASKRNAPSRAFLLVE